MGGVMAALAAVTEACGCLNTAFDCIGRCCPNCCGGRNTEPTPLGNSNNQSTRDGDATANNHLLCGNQVINNCCVCHLIWGRQKIPARTPPPSTQIPPTAPRPSTQTPPTAAPTAPPTTPPLSTKIPPTSTQIPPTAPPTAPSTTPPPADANTEEENTANNQSVGNTTTTINQSVVNTTMTSNTQSSGNNQHIEINVRERTSQLTSVVSVTAAVLAATVITAYLTNRLRKKGEDGSTPTPPTAPPAPPTAPTTTNRKNRFKKEDWRAHSHDVTMMHNSKEKPRGLGQDITRMCFREEI